MVKKLALIFVLFILNNVLAQVAEEPKRKLFSLANFREVGFVTGFGHGLNYKSTYEGVYRPIYCIFHIGQDLTRFIKHKQLQKGIFTLYNEPQFNLVLIQDITNDRVFTEFEAGLNSGLKYMYPLNKSIYIYISGGTGPHFFTTHTVTQYTGFIFSDNFGIGAYLNLDSKWKLHLGYRLRHMSNINIWLPNNGINTHNYHFGLSYFLW